MSKKVSIRSDIYKKMEERVRVTNFSSVDEYVSYILEQVIAKFEKENEVYSDEGEEKIKERLRGLGYIS